MSIAHQLALPTGHVIDKYRIESVVGYGGFGIVYKAVHAALEQQVAIKEYLPQEIATREGTTVRPLSDRETENYIYGKDRFLAEAKQLAGFRHTNIVGCNDFVEDNGTAYLVMDFEDGLPLSELLRSRQRQNKPLSEDEIKRIVLPLLDGLDAVHAHGVLHRDIKPANIFIRRKTEQPVLIDFGSAKQGFSEHSKSMAPYTEGYAAMEQIEEAGNLGPWTDIYALGAVMWRIIANDNPPKVESRSFAAVRNQPDPLKPAAEIGKGQHSAAFLQTIDKCLQVQEADRYQSAKELQQALSDADEDEPVPPPVPDGFKENVEACFEECWNFSGRASRVVYWHWIAFVCLSLVVHPILIGLLSVFLPSGILPWVVALYLLCLVFIVIATLSVTVRRLHDVGHTGKWLFMPIVSILLGAWPTVAALTFTASLVSIFYWLAKKGDAGENRYGPVPLP